MPPELDENSRLQLLDILARNLEKQISVSETQISAILVRLQAMEARLSAINSLPSDVSALNKQFSELKETVAKKPEVDKPRFSLLDIFKKK